MLPDEVALLVAFVYFGAQLDFVKKHFNPTIQQGTEDSQSKQEDVTPTAPDEQIKPKPGLPSEEIKKSIKNKEFISASVNWHIERWESTESSSC